MLDSEGSSQLIEAIYDAALDAAHWPQVLGQLARGFRSASAHLSADDFAMKRGWMVSSGADPVYARSYAEYYASRNVLWQQWMRRSRDGVLTDRTLMPKDELRRSEFYNDFLRPQDGEELLISVPLRHAQGASCLTLWRPERMGCWGAGEMDALAALTPHLRRALRVNEILGERRLIDDLAREVLHRFEHGIVVVGPEARALFVNRAAEAMLADDGGLHIDRRRLAARRPADTAALRRLIAAAAQGGAGGSLVIARDARPALVVVVVPIRKGGCSVLHYSPSAMVLIKDLERPVTLSLTAFTQYFGLTPAQAALANELISGDGVAAAAMRLGISYATARSHVLQIFQKTGTQRQAELVRLMLEWNDGPMVKGKRQ